MGEEENTARRIHSLTDLFKRSHVPLLKRLTTTVLCPQVDYDDLTLESEDQPYRMHPIKCSHLKCNLCGPTKKLDLQDSNFIHNQDEISVWAYEDCPRAGNTVQEELVMKKMKVSYIFLELFIPQLMHYLPHQFSIQFLHRNYYIKTRKFQSNVLMKTMDFSTPVPLEASKLLCGSTRRYGALEVFYVFSNPRFVTLSDNNVVRVHDTEVFYALCETLDKGKKNDWVFHVAMSNEINRLKMEEQPQITEIWDQSDCCAGQYRCRQNFFEIAQLPSKYPHLEKVHHSFSAPYNGKGPWDNEGGVIKLFIKAREREQSHRYSTVLDCCLGVKDYIKLKEKEDKVWKELEESRSPLLARKKHFSVNKRHVYYLTDSQDEYDRCRLQYGDQIGLIFTNREFKKNNHDTKTIEGTTSFYSFFAEKGNTIDGGFELKMQKYPCSCKVCIGEMVGSCQFQGAIGPIVSRILKNNATSDSALPDTMRQIIEKYDGKDFQYVTVKELDQILRFIGVTAIRLEPQGSGKRRIKTPLKSCKISAIQSAGGWTKIKEILVSHP